MYMLLGLVVGVRDLVESPWSSARATLPTLMHKLAARIAKHQPARPWDV